MPQYDTPNSSVRVRLSPVVGYGALLAAASAVVVASFSVGGQTATQTGINTAMSDRVGKLEIDTSARFAAVEKRYDEVIAKLDKVASSQYRMEGQIENIVKLGGKR